MSRIIGSPSSKTITLRELALEYDLTFSSHPNGCLYIADSLVPRLARWPLFHLADYAVSSVTAGMIWLVAREVPL